MDSVTANVEKSAVSPPRLLIFGCGYLGIRVAKASVSAGHVVYATTRRASRGIELAAAGLIPILADWNDPQSLERLPEFDRILIAVSFDRKSGVSRHESQVGGLGRLLKVVPAQTHLCYISTTGVYHQTDGSWVDERSPTVPTREGGQAHLAAETLLREQRPHSKSTILRLAGIYGPQRVPRAAEVIAGKPIASPEEGYLNLIHVVDAAAAVDASWDSASEPLYLVADDHPVVRGEFYREISRQCDVPPPTFAPASPESPVSMRSESNKRIRNERMKRDLLPTLRFPSYREGLANVLQHR